MSDLNELMQALGEAGGDRSVLADAETAHLSVSSNSILSSRLVPGIDVEAKELRNGISAKVTVREGVKLAKPVHLCFGVLHKKGTQRILMDVNSKNSSPTFIATVSSRRPRRCATSWTRPSISARAPRCATQRRTITACSAASRSCQLRVRSEKNGRYFTDFTLTTGRVGKLGIDYEVSAGEGAVVELTARVFGHGNDDIKIREKVVLDGESARGMIKARVAIEDDATAEITGITEGNAAYSRGHVDCMEIVKDRAVAKAIPLVQVTHPLAKVTHEAAIGSVDKRQMETLMAHGLSPEEAVDVIVKDPAVGRGLTPL
jgi:Fe-S cluster assembly scaffold protein SufB